MEYGQGSQGPALIDAGPAGVRESRRWTPTCAACGDRAEVDEIDLVSASVTMSCARCGVSWAEPVAGGEDDPAETGASATVTDFAGFGDLEGSDRATVIVRVLCGLVVLGDDAVRNS